MKVKEKKKSLIIKEIVVTEIDGDRAHYGILQCTVNREYHEITIKRRFEMFRKLNNEVKDKIVFDR